VTEQEVREALADGGLVAAHAAGDDDAPVLGHRLADGVEGFRAGRIEKAAGVHDDHVGTVIVGRDRIALAAQPREDALGIDKRLGAAEADDSDGRGLAGHGCSGSGCAGGHS
jgi:hypothetical protein